MRWDPPPRIIRPKERNVRLRSNMGYLSGRNPLWGTARGDRAFPPCGGAAFLGARAIGLWVGEQKPLGKTPLRGNPSPQSTYLPTSMGAYGGPNVVSLCSGGSMWCWTVWCWW